MNAFNIFVRLFLSSAVAMFVTGLFSMIMREYSDWERAIPFIVLFIFGLSLIGMIWTAP